MPFIRACLQVGSCILLVALLAPRAAGQDYYSVYWESPSEGPSGSMPLGNGEMSVNAWVEESGDLLFYIGRTDAWGDNGRLLKLGRVRVHLEPSPILSNPVFGWVQRLNLSDATMWASYSFGSRVVRLWVDANHPVVHVTVGAQEACEMIVSLEPWRLEPDELASIEVSDVMLDRSKPGSKHAPTIVEPDTLLSGLTDRIGWYHHNRKSVGPELTAKLQGLDGLERPDPLLGRTFGAICLVDDPERFDETRLRSRKSTSHHLRVYTHTSHPASPEEWLEEIDEVIERTESIDLPKRRAAHEAWWREF